MGMINVVAMLPQLLNILLTHKVEGLSLTMVSLYLAIQVCFGINGFIKRDIPFFVTMLLSAAMSISVILSTIIIRYS